MGAQKQIKPQMSFLVTPADGKTQDNTLEAACCRAYWTHSKGLRSPCNHDQFSVKLGIQHKIAGGGLCGGLISPLPPAPLYSFSLPFPSPALSHRSLTLGGFLEVLIHHTAGCAHESHGICLYFQSCERHLGSGRATSPSSFYRMKDLNSYSKQRLL